MTHCWNTDVQRYSDGTIATIVTARTDNDSNNPTHAFIYCRYNGSTWSSTYLGNAGLKLYSSEQDYTGLAAMHPNTPDIIYISTTYDPRDSTFLTKHEIFKGVTKDSGKTWAWTPITENSTMDNLRPIVPAWENYKTALIWFRGTYYSAQNIDAQIVGIITDETSTLPVELTSFSAAQSGSTIQLKWNTATEVNNRGFEIEKQVKKNNEYGDWFSIGFKEGKGTSSQPVSYSYGDNNIDYSASSVRYRLKQIDYEGTSEYSNIVEVNNISPTNYALTQNYPNPFNPTTTIKYSIPQDNFVSLKVFNVIGKEVATLVNKEMKTGTFTVNWNAGNLPSGVYFYKLSSGNFLEIRKMVLLK